MSKLSSWFWIILTVISGKKIMDFTGPNQKRKWKKDERDLPFRVSTTLMLHLDGGKETRGE